MRDPQKIQRQLYILSGVIAAVGAVCSTLAYLDAAAGPHAGAMGGVVNSKLYRRGLLLYGGQLNVVFDDFSRWFASLWEGRNLALSLAVITVVLAGICFLVARNIVDAFPGPNGE